MRWVMLGVCAVALGGCSLLPEWAVRDRSSQAEVTPVVAAPTVEDAGVEAPVDAPVDAPDAETPAPPDTDVADVSVGTLGRTVASLGNAAEPGLWLKTPLVSVEQPGRVYYAETNSTVDVTLIPIQGPDTAGSRLSLAAMQALGAPLTGLPEVDVFGG